MLDSIDTAILVFDEEGRSAWWNEALIAFFPRLAALIHQGSTFEVLMTESYRLGEIVHQMTDDEIIAHARRVMETVDKAPPGPFAPRIVHTTYGRVLEARDFRTPEGSLVVTRTDVTALHRKETELEALNQRLNEANENLQRFSALAAHDLRAPLRAMTALPVWIGEGLAGLDAEIPGEILNDLELMQNQAKRMDTLVSDLLAYARLDDIASRLETFDPRDRVSDIAALVVPDGRFTFEITSEIGSLRANPVEFDIVIRNLLSNAVKHSDRDQGRIVVCCCAEGADAMIELSDNGPGIPEKFRKRVFEPFQTLVAKDKNGGSGLGLSFVQRVVDRWGGRIELGEGLDGRGCAVRFSIPSALNLGKDASRPG